MHQRKLARFLFRAVVTVSIGWRTTMWLIVIHMSHFTYTGTVFAIFFCFFCILHSSSFYMYLFSHFSWLSHALFCICINSLHLYLRQTDSSVAMASQFMNRLHAEDDLTQNEKKSPGIAFMDDYSNVASFNCNRKPFRVLSTSYI